MDRIKNKEFINSWEDYILQPLFFNKDIRIDNIPLYNKKWYKKGIVTINDILRHDGTFLTLEDFQNKYDVSTNFLEYNGIINAIKKEINKRKIPIQNFKISNPYIPRPLQIFLYNMKGSKAMYNILISNSTTPTGQTKWNNTLLHQTNDQWKAIFNLPFKTLLGPKLKWMQFRINHYIY